MNTTKKTITAMWYKFFRSNADKWMFGIAVALFIGNLVAGLIWPRV